MMHKEHIAELIQKSDEAVYDLSTYLRRSGNRDVVCTDMVDLAMNGNLKERFACLTVLANEQPALVKAKLPSLTATILGSPASNAQIVPPILSIIMNLKLTNYVAFCRELFEFAEKNGLPQIKSMAFRALIFVDWTSVRDILEQVVAQEPDRILIDIMAYFRHKNGDVEFCKFLNALPAGLQQKVSSRDAAIIRRLMGHYMKFART